MNKIKHKYNTVKNTILSDRRNGFKNTAYAVAELIDNSIQSAFRLKHKKTEVTLIIVEEKFSISGKNYDRISEIHVFDEAEGMDQETLGKALSKGQSENKNDVGYGRMGRYGFGLYMSSISQCKRTEIHTWQNKRYLKSWLDIDEIVNSEEEIEYVPVQEIEDLPKNIKDIIPKTFEKNGTVVSWTNLDLTKWKTATGLFKNVEDEIGRIYRYFINDGSVQIKFKFFKKTGGNYKLVEENFVRPNDPLYLMKNTTCPNPWSKKAGFVESRPEKLHVNLNGNKHEILIKFAIATEEFRGKEKPAGSEPHGKHALRNNGVSIIRSGRELEVNKSWNNPSESRWRWANAEIHFDGIKEMDDFFQVKPNKTGAENIYYRDIKKIISDYEMTEPAYMNYLQETNQEEYVATKISNKIKERLDDMIETIKEYRSKKSIPIGGTPEDTTSKYRNKRKNKTQQDKEKEKATKAQRIKAMQDRLVASGMSEDEAMNFAKASIDRDISTIITSEKISSPYFFDVRFNEGQYQIIINKSHPAYLEFFNLLEKESEGRSFEEPSSDRAVKLMLAAWASLEDESSSTNSEYSNHLQDIKLRWSQIFRDLLTINKD